MGLKDVTEATDIAGVEECIQGMGDKNGRHDDANYIETAAGVVHWATKPTEPTTLHTVS